MKKLKDWKLSVLFASFNTLIKKDNDRRKQTMPSMQITLWVFKRIIDDVPGMWARVGS
ncbi:hypothetical protein MYP_1157 [Sporocytophaga myxococcoides]|uniref:Uncharacterized protein n=1 Tax=Sporocytophaga myxococcoides TaxID=153721 RepID=A0A098LBY1_9BACT|nr:hypothetical protein MYP_1157 [Sporocytophaga myxococcoides]